MTRRAIAALLLASTTAGAAEWTESELRTLRSLSLVSLRRPPYDPSNRYADDEKAAELGRRLFFDARLSRNGQVSCASCHQPNRFFTDGLARSRGIGETRRGAPTLIGAAYSPWLYWDGRRDSLWSQALAAIEGPEEMGGSRVRAVRAVAADPGYRSAYESIFDRKLPDLTDESPAGADAARVDRAFTDLGKAIAAYERKLNPAPSRFDVWVRHLVDGTAPPDPPMSEDELAGLRVFLRPTSQCLRCHNGPLFTNHGFHNTGVPVDPDAGPDQGRLPAVAEVRAHEFNCFSPYSDAVERQCLELRFIKDDGVELLGAFKVPTLRNVAMTAPYMHAGQFDTLDAVLRHYGRPGFGIGHQELMPTNFDEAERRQLAAFLGTLTSDVAVSPP